MAGEVDIRTPHPMPYSRCRLSPPPHPHAQSTVLSSPHHASRTFSPQVVIALVAGPLSAHPRMSAQDASSVQLVLTFLRNLLEVPDEEQRVGCGPGNGNRTLQVRGGGGGEGRAGLG